MAALSQALVPKNVLYPRRGCAPLALVATGLGLVLLSPVLIVYLLLGCGGGAVIAWPLLYCVRGCRSKRRWPGKMCQHPVRLLSLGPWGEHFDALWMPWWRLCCRRHVGTYVSPTGEHRAVTLRQLPPRPDGCVRFVVISDTHAKMRHVDVPHGDVLVHCGDALARGGKGRCTSGRGLVAAFAGQLGRLPHPHKVFVGGNHDQPIARMGPAAAAELFAAHGVTYLEGTGCTVAGGLRVWGLPYYPASRTSPNKAFHRPEAIEAQFAAVPADTHVLVTHGAPHQPGAAAGWDAMFGRCRQLRLHAMGHFHDLHGVWLEEATRLVTVNAATCDPMYRALQGAMVVDIAAAAAGAGAGAAAAAADAAPEPSRL